MLPKDNLFKNIFDSTTAGDWDCVVAVERLSALHYSVDCIFLSFVIIGSICKFEIMSGSLMRPKWPKLASLAQKPCTLWFQFLVHSLLPRDNLFKYIFDSTTAGHWDCVAAVERIPVLHYSVDFIFLSFGIMGFIWEL